MDAFGIDIIIANTVINQKAGKISGTENLNINFNSALSGTYQLDIYGSLSASVSTTMTTVRKDVA